MALNLLARPVSPPRIWNAFARCWQLPPPLARQWWSALRTSHYARPRALRQLLLTFDAVPTADVEHLIHQVCAPRQLMAVLEDLVHEQRLRRAQASRIEHYILVWVNKDGHWR
jgi:hypothetical protein